MVEKQLSALSYSSITFLKENLLYLYDFPLDFEGYVRAGMINDVVCFGRDVKKRFKNEPI